MRTHFNAGKNKKIITFFSITSLIALAAVGVFGFLTNIKVSATPYQGNVYTYVPVTGTTYVTALVENRYDSKSALMQYKRDYPINPGTEFRYNQKGDFDGNGSVDIFYRDIVSGETKIEFYSSSSIIDGDEIINTINYGIVDFNWNTEAVGDITGDGIDEIIWQNKLSGHVLYWSFNSGGYLSSGGDIATGLPSDWDVEIFDETSNNLYLRKTSGPSTGQVVTWNINNSGLILSSVPTSSSVVDFSWRMFGAHNNSIYWSNNNDNSVVKWDINPSTYTVDSGYFLGSSATETDVEFDMYDGEIIQSRFEQHGQVNDYIFYSNNPVITNIFMIDANNNLYLHDQILYGVIIGQIF